jgi:hypothetical protein
MDTYLRHCLLLILLILAPASLLDRIALHLMTLLTNNRFRYLFNPLLLEGLVRLVDYKASQGKLVSCNLFKYQSANIRYGNLPYWAHACIY